MAPARNIYLLPSQMQNNIFLHIKFEWWATRLEKIWFTETTQKHGDSLILLKIDRFYWYWEEVWEQKVLTKHCYSLETLHNRAGIYIIWQCGKRYLDTLIKKIDLEDYPRLRLHAFLEDMPAAYAVADLVVMQERVPVQS